MNGLEALRAARGASVFLGIEGDELVLKAALAPPTAVLDELFRHKASILALLRRGSDGWSAEDWQVYFDERAGIAQFDGGLARAEAEAQAFECCVGEWLNRNPAQSSPDRCVHCGGSGGDALLPYGTEKTAWLHSRCWEAWHSNQKSTAVTMLSSL